MLPLQSCGRQCPFLDQHVPVKAAFTGQDNGVGATGCFVKCKTFQFADRPMPPSGGVDDSLDLLLHLGKLAGSAAARHAAHGAIDEFVERQQRQHGTHRLGH